MNINWYPGHMKKTKETIVKNLSLVDIVFEIADARIPFSSRNPLIDRILKDKPRIIVLNKMDLASSKGNKLWQSFFIEKEIPAVLVNALKGENFDKLLNIAHIQTSYKRKVDRKKGIINRPIRAMIVGIPNVGKSTLINVLTGRKGARIGNKPGITKSIQWIKTKSNLELLDTPGILWPKFNDKEVGLNLAFTGSIKDEILDNETLALRLIERLLERESKNIEKRYKISTRNKSALDIIEDIGIKRACIIRGGQIDYSKTSNIILDEFRKAKIGRITLEFPKVGV